MTNSVTTYSVATVTGVTRRKLTTAKTWVDLFSLRAKKLNFIVLFSKLYWLKKKGWNLLFPFCFVIGQFCLSNPGNSCWTVTKLYINKRFRLDDQASKVEPRGDY